MPAQPTMSLSTTLIQSGPKPAHRAIPLVLVGVGAVVVAVLANLLLYVVGERFVTYQSTFDPLATVTPTILLTAAFGALGVVVFALIRRFSRRPRRTIITLGVLSLVASLVPDLLVIPGEPGSSAGQTLILILMHVVAAAVIVTAMALASSDTRQDGADQERI